MPTQKRSNKKYGKLQAKLAEEIPWNRICVDINGLSVIGRTVTMIDPVTWWSEKRNILIKQRYQLLTLLKLCVYLDTLDQYKSRMTKEKNLLVTSSETP